MTKKITLNPPYTFVIASSLSKRQSTKAHVETNEVEGHYLHVTAGTCEEILKRVEFAKEIGTPIIMYYLIKSGFTRLSKVLS